MRIALAAFLIAPALVAAQEALNPCDLISTNEVATMVGADPARVKTRFHTTRAGVECTFLGAGQKSLLVVEVRKSNLPKADLDQEAENLQKLYRTSVVPVAQLGDQGFWLPGRRELFFRKGKQIVRVVMEGASGDAKVIAAKTESAGRLIESRLK